MTLICMKTKLQNSFSYERFHTRLETEAQENSEMTYFLYLHYHWIQDENISLDHLKLFYIQWLVITLIIMKNRE